MGEPFFAMKKGPWCPFTMEVHFSSHTGNEELREGADNFCFIMNTKAMHLIAKTFQCCGSELEVKKVFNCRRELIVKIRVVAIARRK